MYLARRFTGTELIHYYNAALYELFPQVFESYILFGEACLEYAQVLIFPTMPGKASFPLESMHLEKHEPRL